MSTAVDQNNKRDAAPVETLYTICPVVTVANVDVELGWLDEEFTRARAKAVYLR